MTKTITLAELEDVSFSGLTAEEKETSINWYYGDKTAVGGKWLKGPGYSLFAAILDNLFG